MGRHRLAVSLAGVAIAAAVFAAVWFTLSLSGDSGSSTTGAAALPTACENFAEASAQFARNGSTAAVTLTGGYRFARDSRTDSAVILRDLLDACDRELASR